MKCPGVFCFAQGLLHFLHGYSGGEMFDGVALGSDLLTLASESCFKRRHDPCHCLSDHQEVSMPPMQLRISKAAVIAILTGGAHQ